MDPGLGGLLQPLSRSWRLLPVLLPMSCRLLRWSCRGEIRLLPGGKAQLGTGYKRDTLIPTGGSFDEGARDFVADAVDRAIASNAVSLVCGIVGNMFLLLNFTQSVRYIIALPFTIVLWFLATGIVSRIPSSSLWHVLTSSES